MLRRNRVNLHYYSEIKTETWGMDQTILHTSENGVNLLYWQAPKFMNPDRYR